MPGCGRDSEKAEEYNPRKTAAYGQFIFVLPKQDAVLAVTSSVNDMQSVMNAVWDGLLPARDDGEDALEPSPEAARALAEKLASLHISAPASTAASKPSGKSGIRYRLSDNPMCLEYVELREGVQGGGEVVWTQNGKERELKYGDSDWVLNEWTKATPVMRAAASGCWTDEETFVLTVRAVETAFNQTYRCRFEGNAIRIAYDCEYNLFGPKELTLGGQAVTSLSR